MYDTDFEWEPEPTAERDECWECGATTQQLLDDPEAGIEFNCDGTWQCASHVRVIGAGR